MMVKSLDGQARKMVLSCYAIKWSKPSCSRFQTRVKKFLKENFSDLSWFEEVGLVADLHSLRVDFVCHYRDVFGKERLLFVEADGLQHVSYNKFFFKDEDAFLESAARDSLKEAFAELNDIQLLRIYPDDEPLTLEKFNEKFNYPLFLAQKMLD